MKTGLKTARDTDLPTESSAYSKAIVSRNGKHELETIGYGAIIAPGTDYISKSMPISQSVTFDFTVKKNFAAKNRIYTAYDPANNIDFGMSSNSSLYFGTQDPLSKSHTVGDYRVKSTGSSWVVERCTVGGTWGEGTWIKDCGCGGEIQGDQNIPELNLEPLPDFDGFVDIMKAPPVEVRGEWDCIEAVLSLIRRLQAEYNNTYKRWETLMYCIENNIAGINIYNGGAQNGPVELVPVPACYCYKFAIYNAYIDNWGRPYHVYHDNRQDVRTWFYTLDAMITIYNNSYMEGFDGSRPNLILDVNHFPCLSLPENQYLIDRYNAIRNQFTTLSAIII